MKPPPPPPFIVTIAFFLMMIIFGLLCINVNSQAAVDSCSSNLILINAQIPFDTTSLTCQSVWDSQNFILRYAQTAPSVWSFILSAPNTNSYVAMGFSPNGAMVGSSAIVGWATSDGSGTMQKYYLGGQVPNQVRRNQGNLQLLGNTSSIFSESSRIYIIFQLDTILPQHQLLYAVGQTAALPVPPNFALTQHSDSIATTINYASGQSSRTKSPYSNLRKSHGILNMLGWGILMPIGALVARHMKHMDPVWFYAHTTIQSLGFILGIVGVTCGFLLNDRIKANVDKHKGLGIFILVLGCLQVMAFLARPDKVSKVRKYWNWYHYSVGRILIFLAAVNVFYGIHLGKAGTVWNAGYGIVLVILFIVAVILEVKMLMRK